MVVQFTLSLTSLFSIDACLMFVFLLSLLRRSFDSSSAVCVGIASAEYNNWLLRRHPQGMSAYGATGGALSVASGRLSYLYGLKGPSLSVDTAW